MNIRSSALHHCRAALLALAALSVAAVAGAATPPMKVTLQSAIAVALERNPALRSALTAPDASEGRETIARAALMPNLSATASEIRQSRPDVQLGGLGGAFGGSLFATDISDRRVSLTQALLDIRSLAGARAAGELTRAARGDADQARVNLVADVKTAFYDLLFSGEAHRVASETVAQVERQLAQANSLVAAGTAPHLDEIRAEVQLANVKSALIRAEYQTEIARETLAHLMAVKASTPVEAQGEFLGVEPVATREVLLKQAAGGRPDLRAARRRLAAARSGLRSARAGRLPTVNFTAAYDKSQGQRFPLGEELDIKSATVNVNLPIFDGQLTDGRVQEAEAQRLKAQHDLEALEQQIELDVTRATALVAQSEAVISATQKAVQQAREALDIANEAYRVGTRTYLELLDAQLALSVADINRSQAQRDYSVARAALDRALGLPDPRQPQLASSRTTKETTK